MSGVDNTVLVLNVLLAFAAGVINLAAAVRPGPFGQWAPVRAAIAVLAFFYSFAYAVLAAGLVPLEQWSPFMRGVSLVAWPLVWIAPSALSWLIWRRAKQEAASQIAAIREAASAV